MKALAFQRPADYALLGDLLVTAWACYLNFIPLFAQNPTRTDMMASDIGEGPVRRKSPAPSHHFDIVPGCVVTHVH